MKIQFDGLWGVLRDCFGNMLSLFFGPFCEQESNYAKILTTRNALHFYVDSPWKGVKSLII